MGLEGIWGLGMGVESMGVFECRYDAPHSGEMVHLEGLPVR